MRLNNAVNNGGCEVVRLNNGELCWRIGFCLVDIELSCSGDSNA